jgi:hypothetical protein
MGKAPYFINPVNTIMSSEHDLTLTMNVTYTWRVKMSAGMRNRFRLCARYNGKRKVSRLNPCCPSLPLSLAEGPTKMCGKIQTARAADPKSNEPSPTSRVLKRVLAEVPSFFVEQSFLIK